MSRIILLLFLLTAVAPVFAQELIKSSDEVRQVLTRTDEQLRQGQVREALALLDQGIERFPDAPDLLVRRGSVRLQAGNIEGARKDLDRAVELAPKAARTRYLRARLFANLQEWKSALTDLDEALRLGGRVGEYLSLRGTARKATRDMDGALQDFSEAVELEPKRFDFRLNRGFLFLQRKDFENALADFDAVLQLQGNEPMAYLGKSEVYRFQGRSEERMKMLDLIIANDTPMRGIFQETVSVAGKVRTDGNSTTQMLVGSLSWMAHGQKAHEYYRLEKFPEAIQEFNVVLAASPNDVISLLMRGQSLVKLGKYEAAVKDFDEGVRYSTDQKMKYMFFLERGLALTYLEKDTEAQKDFEAAIALEPESRASLEKLIENARRTRRPGAPEKKPTEH